MVVFRPSFGGARGSLYGLSSGILVRKAPSSCTEQEWLELLQGMYPIGEIKAMRRLWLDAASVSEDSEHLDEGSMHPSWTRLLHGEPIQYVLGKAYFMGLELSVGPGVLIPRSETEELVEWVLSDPKVKTSMENGYNSGNPTFLDLGTGSGCIALALAKHLTNSEVIALDCEDQALHIAKGNAMAWGVSARFQIYKADFMASEWKAPEARFWISNPPYIAREAAATMDKHIIDFEPSVALFAPGSHPLEVYRTLIMAFLASDSAECFWMELNPRYAIDIVRLVDEVDEVESQDLLAMDNPEWCGENKRLEWSLRKDMQGHWRMLRILQKI